VGIFVQGHLHAGEGISAPKNARTSPPRSVSIEPIRLLLRTLWRRVRGSVDRQRSIAAGNVDASGRIPHRDRYRRQQGGDPVEKRLDGAGTGQVEEDPILVLFDLYRHFEERENHG